MPGTILHQLLTERGRRRTFQITNATWLNNASRPRWTKLGKLTPTLRPLCANRTQRLRAQPREQLDPYRGENETNNFEIR
jgi:hypothetical protein